MDNYHHSDEWSGGAWLTAGDKSAVIFVGTKGLGDCWYGCSDGTVWPEEPPYPLLIGFFADGTFKAVFTGHRFETYHNFWGEWSTEGDSLTLTITGGNDLPSQSTYQGRYEVRENELVLLAIVASRTRRARVVRFDQVSARKVMAFPRGRP